MSLSSDLRTRKEIKIRKKQRRTKWILAEILFDGRPKKQLLAELLLVVVGNAAVFLAHCQLSCPAHLFSTIPHTPSLRFFPRFPGMLTMSRRLAVKVFSYSPGNLFKNAWFNAKMHPAKVDETAAFSRSTLIFLTRVEIRNTYVCIIIPINIPQKKKKNRSMVCFMISKCRNRLYYSMLQKRVTRLTTGSINLFMT